MLLACFYLFVCLCLTIWSYFVNVLHVLGHPGNIILQQARTGTSLMRITPNVIPEPMCCTECHLRTFLPLSFCNLIRPSLSIGFPSNRFSHTLCPPFLFHISSFALLSTGISKDKRVHKSNETPADGLELRSESAHLLSLFPFFLDQLHLFLSAAVLQPEGGKKSISIKRRALEKRFDAERRRVTLSLDRWEGSNLEG